MTDPAERQAQQLTDPGETTDQTDRGGLDDVGDLYAGSVVINTQEMGRAVRFWVRALGYRLRGAEVDPAWNVLVDPAGHKFPLSLQLTDRAPAEPVRLHLDLYTAEQERQIERLVGLGATRAPEWVYPAESNFVVLRDPDGNEFCVIDQPTV